MQSSEKYSNLCKLSEECFLFERETSLRFLHTDANVTQQAFQSTPMQYSIIFLFLCVFIARSNGQTVTEIIINHRSDEIPSKVTTGRMRVLKLLPSWSSVEASASYQSMTLDDAYGLSARTLRLLGIQFLYSLPLYDKRVFLSAGPRLEFLTAGKDKLASGYVASIRTDLLSDADAISIQGVFAVDREFYQGGVLSLDQKILRERARITLTGEYSHYLSVALHGERLFLSDHNVIDNLYAYALISVLHTPELRMGYAFQYSDSRNDHWTITDSKLVESGNAYAYTYFYVPYFTPLNESGHLALASIRWSPSSWIAVRFRAAVPVSSKSYKTWSPPYGVDTSPAFLGTRYKERNILQTTFSGALEFQLSPTQWLALEVERFEKPYYTYSQAQLKLTMTY